MKFAMQVVIWEETESGKNNNNKLNCFAYSVAEKSPTEQEKKNRKFATGDFDHLKISKKRGKKWKFTWWQVLPFVES